MSHPDDGVLQELLDGELSPADEAVVRAHVAGCAPCTTALAELRAMQLEADAIVTRLDLEPPLHRPATRPRAAARRFDLRLLGLAASAVLVAGTSWLLLRSPDAANRLQGADTASGVILPLPAGEREEVSAATPAARPTEAGEPRARADAANEMERRVSQNAGKAKEAALPAEEKDLNAKGLDDRPALRAPEPVLAKTAANSAPTAFLTLDSAEARMGGRVFTIDGLTPQLVELITAGPDSQAQVRQTYVVGGVPVILVQRGAGSPLATLQARDEVTTKRERANLEQEPQKQGLAAGAAVTPAIQRRTWEANGVRFSIQGTLPVDSLNALARRVR